MNPRILTALWHQERSIQIQGIWSMKPLDLIRFRRLSLLTRSSSRTRFWSSTSCRLRFSVSLFCCNLRSRKALRCCLSAKRAWISSRLFHLARSFFKVNILCLKMLSAERFWPGTFGQVWRGWSLLLSCLAMRRRSRPSKRLVFRPMFVLVLLGHVLPVPGLQIPLA